MKTETESSALKRSAGTVAVIELAILLAIVMAGVIFGWSTLRPYGMALALAGVAMMFLGCVSPIGQPQVSFVSAFHSTQTGDSAFMVEMCAVGIVNAVLGILIAAVGS